MTILILTAVPSGLRGHLTRWLLELSPGVFIGHVSARVRDTLWQRTIEHIGSGRAIMAHTARTEQRFAFKVAGHDWQPIDFNGVTLMRREKPPKAKRASTDPPHGDRPHVTPPF